MNHTSVIRIAEPGAVTRYATGLTGIFHLIRIILIVTAFMTTDTTFSQVAGRTLPQVAGEALPRVAGGAFPNVEGGAFPRISGRAEGDDEYWTIVYSGEITGRGVRSPGRIISDLIFGSPRLYLNKPVGITAREGDVWLLNQGDGNILRMSDNRAILPPAIRRTKTSYPSLVGITMTEGGRILFTDSKLNKVFSLSADGRELFEFNSDLVLKQPTGIAFSAPYREIWIVETALHRITVTDTHGNTIRQIGRRGSGNGEFNYPTSVWIDSRGIAYVVDALNYRVQIFDHEGSFLSSFGKQGDATGSFARPKGIATDSYGHIYITDALFNAVQVFDREGQLLHYFGTQGRNREQFWMPSGIFIDEKNNIYIADSYNSRVQIFRPERRSQR
jgi:sugar lactone lactonase YvrE